MSRLGRAAAQTLCAFTAAAIVTTSAAVADPAATAAPAPQAATTAAPDVASTGPFADVPLNSWAYDAVEKLAADGLIKGYPDGTFKGGRPMTRYEAAVLTHDAVDALEAQLEAHKTVEKSDIDAVNKLLAAYGNELATIQQHVDKLQKQADATSTLADTTKTIAEATAATVRRQQIHLAMWVRTAAYGQNIQASNGPLPVVVNGVTYAPGSALPGGIGTAPTGVSVHGPTTTVGGVVTPGAGAAGGLSWGPQAFAPFPGNSNTTGSYGHALGTQFLALQFGGNPDDNSQYLIKLTNLDRYSATNFYPQEAPAYCTASTIGVGAGAAPCNPGNAGVSDADSLVSSLLRLQDMWYQYTTPGGLYAKVGKFQQDEGPKQVVATQWGLGDYVNGARIGYRTAHFNAQAGWGFEDTAAQNNLLYGLPFSSQVMWGETDYQFDHGRTDIGVYYSNYSGYHETVWDASAVNCVGNTTATAGTAKTLPLLAGQAYTSGGCGAGFSPIVYGAPGANAGLPVTGAYLSTLAGAQAPHDNTLGLFAVENYGKLRLVLEGTDRLGDDPTTGAPWQGNLTGFFQADYGPFLGAPGVRGKNTFELGGFAAGMNGLGAGFAYYAGPALWSQFSTDFADYYFLWGGVKRWISNNANVGVFYVNMGLLPNTTIPAGSPQCPACVISGDSRNALFGELNLAF